jgi:hypothetical protein
VSDDVALVFPPGWYYTAHPADLSYPAGFLRAAGLRVRTVDLASRLLGVLFGDLPAAAALRSPATYADPARHAAASRDLRDRAAAVAARHGVRYTLRQLGFPGADPDHWPTARALGRSARNPALPLLTGAARALAASGVPLIALALVHPDQRPQVAALSSLLRDEGYAGTVVVYGVMEDVLSPLDFAPDLEGEPVHDLFRDVDAVVVGESERPLLELARRAAWGSFPGVIAPRHGVARLEEAPPVPLELHPGPSFTDLRPHPLAPAPVVDLRLGRGCPWGRCAFCAIQAHQPGYRAGTADAVARAMTDAHAAAGSVFFRVRDDLLTSRQLEGVAGAVAALPFAARWSARARIEPSLGAEVLGAARAGGLEELWVGLESASERVRERMDKGVSDATVERFLEAGRAAGVAVRLLCLVGFPGETPDEARATLDFVARNAARVASFSVTPFQLARRSPMAADPERWGLRLVPDPLPRHERVRWTIPCVVEGAVDGAALVDAAYRDVAPLLPTVLGPDLHHDWMSRSVRAGGWPGSRR